MILHPILTKLSIEMHFNELFKCTEFQLDRNMRLYFMANLAKCAKRRNILEEKNEEKHPKTLAASISEITWAIFFKFSYVGSPTTQALL